MATTPKFRGLSPTASWLAERYGDLTITLEQAAPHLKLTQGTLRNQLHAQEKGLRKPHPPVPFKKMGRKWVVHVRVLADHIDLMDSPEEKAARG